MPRRGKYKPITYQEFTRTHLMAIHAVEAVLAYYSQLDGQEDIADQPELELANVKIDNSGPGAAIITVVGRTSLTRPGRVEATLTLRNWGQDERFRFEVSFPDDATFTMSGFIRRDIKTGKRIITDREVID